MFRVFVLLASVACALGSRIQPRSPLPNDRIVGGQNTVITDHPYQVALRYNGKFVCGGTKISPYHILTAAHCLNDTIAHFSIEYGKTVINSAGSTTIIAAAAKRLHPSYDPQSYDYDVAILFLESPVPHTAASQSIALTSLSPPTGTLAVVTGWGFTSEGGPISTTLQKVTVQIISHALCTVEYTFIKTITDRMLCAGGNGGGKDACRGDSGGPLVAGGVLMGTVSWGYGCARPQYPGVYTNVDRVRQWIIDNAV